MKLQVLFQHCQGYRLNVKFFKWNNCVRERLLLAIENSVQETVVDNMQPVTTASGKVSGAQRLLEAAIVTSTLLSLYLLLALYSFDRADASWTQTAVSGTAANWMGHTGAYLADILLFCVGYLAYLCPFLLAGLGYVLFKAHHKLRAIDYFTMGLRFVGFFLTVFGVLATASINFDNIYSFSGGGIIGDMVAQAMLPNFNFLGTTLLLVCFIATGLTLLTGIGWMQLAESIGYYTLKGCCWIGGLPQRFNRNSRRDESVDSDDTLAAPVTKTNRSEEPSFDLNANAKIAKANLPEPELAAASVIAIKSEPAEAVPSTDIVSATIEPQDDDSPEIEFSPYQRPDHDEMTSEDIAQPSSTEQLSAAISAIQPKVIAEDSPEPVIEPPAAVGLLPSLTLLDNAKKKFAPIAQEDLDRVSRLVEEKLLDFNIIANVVDVYPGPVITRFELDLAPGVKVSKISALSKDLARSLSALSVRIVEVIPGKSVIGLEIPNEHRETVYLRENLSSDAFASSASPLTMVLGKDISGAPVVVDLGKMPHLLVAGTTGSGKSVGVNAMIVSLLYKSTPEQVRMIMIDPKMLELSVYEGIPHLLSEVVTDMKEAANALRWCVGEMERRYKVMSAVGVRNLKGYNAKIDQARADGAPLVDPLWKPGDSMDPTAPELENLPSIVVVVDEFADMIMIVGKKVEELIARIAQKARAAGIHLILATQRPSVDVITGLIKANIPTRIAFQVSSRIDSRTILDQQGAEQLLGMGDMLYLPPGTGVPTRVHGAFVDDHEVHKVVADWKKRGKPNYIEAILSGDSNESILLPGEAADGDDENDEFYDEAVAFVTETRRGSISSVQRKFKIGYNRAARLIEQMEASGIVSSPGHNGLREVIAPPAPKM